MEDYVVPAILAGGVVNLLIFGMYSGKVTLRQMKRFGAPMDICERVSCEEASRMMVDFLIDSLEADGRGHRETDAGCSGLSVLRESKDIPKLIDAVHVVGGRLVLRKRMDCDIENSSNGKTEVQKELSRLDADRSKRVKQKYRR